MTNQSPPPAILELASSPSTSKLRLEVETALIFGTTGVPSGPWRGLSPRHDTLSQLVRPVVDAEPAHRCVTLHDRLLAVNGHPAGVIYTPPPLAEAVVAWSFDQTPNNAGLPDVLEPGCGAGRLLIPMVQQLWRRRSDLGEVLNAIRAEEIDSDAAEIARRVIWYTLYRLGANPPWPLSPDPVHVVDSLVQPLTPCFDLIIGNPPYAFGSAIKPERRRWLAERFAMARGGQRDLFRVFIEATLRRARPHGVHGFLIPDALLARDELAQVRRWLHQNATLVAIGRCRRAFSKPSWDGKRKQLGLGAIFMLSQRGATSGSPKICEWDTSANAFSPLRDAIADALPSNGDAWQLDAPSWWFGADGLRAKLDASQKTLGDFLHNGTSGASRGEELGLKALSSNPRPVESSEHCTIITGRDLHRLSTTNSNYTIPRTRISKPETLYRAPRVLVVKTGSTPVAAADLTTHPTLQSVYILHPVDGVTVWALAAILSSAWIAAYACLRWTSVKSVQPQLTLSNIRSLPMPHPLTKTTPRVDSPLEKAPRAPSQ